MQQDPIRRADHDRVAVLTIDCPGRSMNVVDEAVLGSLREHLAAIAADDAIGAVVLASGKDGTFGAGADVSWLPELAARDDAEDLLADVHRLMVDIADGPTPMVTAINGTALGGALELALAGHAILAVPEATVGLPEVTLSLLPGGGGTQMLSRWVPVADAAEMLAHGTRLSASDAAEKGLVTEVVAADALLDRAIALASEMAAGETLPASRPASRPADRPSTEEPDADPDAAVAAVREVRDALAGSRRGLSTAAATILDVVEAGVVDGLQAGLAAEREGFLALLRSPEARAALHLFSAESEVRRRARGGDHADVSSLGVVGGGQMGAGIAATAVSRGVATVVRDVAEESLERARGYADRVLQRTAAADGEDPRAALWSGTTAWDGFADADAVIEAVFELPELKTGVLSAVCELVGEDALLATNTSAIPIATLAGAVTRPERFLGMHFFSPVDRMPLVELIPHAGTSEATIRRAASLGRQLGKVGVVVGDAPGFFTSRVYARWLMEGVRLLLDGFDVEAVDRAAKSVGFPVGPLQAHDEATLDLVVKASITQVAEPVMADRLDVKVVREALEALIDGGVEGRRQGAGFHAYDQDGRRAGANPDVARILGAAPRTPAAADAAADGAADAAAAADGGATDDAAAQGEASSRLLLAFVSECLLCWDDGTICHPDDGDVAAVLGIGFPRVLGGPFRWADELGAAEVQRRCAAVGARSGEAAFPAGEAIARLAATGGTLHDEPRRPAPFQPAG